MVMKPFPWHSTGTCLWKLCVFTTMSWNVTNVYWRPPKFCRDGNSGFRVVILIEKLTSTDCPNLFFDGGFRRQWIPHTGCGSYELVVVRTAWYRILYHYLPNVKKRSCLVDFRFTYWAVITLLKPSYDAAPADYTKYTRISHYIQYKTKMPGHEICIALIPVNSKNTLVNILWDGFELFLIVQFEVTTR